MISPRPDRRLHRARHRTATSAACLIGLALLCGAAGAQPALASAGTGSSPAAGCVAASPTVTQVMPTSGPTGITVTISRSHFCGATAVQMGSATASFTVISDTSIHAVVPNGLPASAQR